MRGVWRSQKVQVGGGGAGARTSIVGETYQPARDGVRRGVPEQVLQVLLELLLVLRRKLMRCLMRRLLRLLIVSFIFSLKNEVDFTVYIYITR